LDALLSASQAAARRGGRLLVDQCFNDYSGPTTLVVECYSAGSRSPDSFLILTCNVPQGTLRVADLPAEVKSVSVSRDHPLLLPYRMERYEIFIAGRPAGAEAAYDTLKEIVAQYAADWVGADRFLGDRKSAIKVLLGGYGLLAKAPPPLAHHLRDSLVALGCRPSLLPAASQEQPSSFAESHLRVLVLDPAATLLVSSAACRSTANQASVSALIRKHRGW